MKTELVALKGKVHTQSFQFAENQKLVIGRGEDVGIQVLDRGLSRRHCCLEKCGEEFFISDLDSRNGTWVNGERIRRQKLASGDRIRLGGIEFEFRCEPDRRRAQADIITAMPEKSGTELKRKVVLDQSGLMQLPVEFQTVENYRRIQRDLATIYRVGNLISGEPTLAELYDRILDAIFQVINAHRGFLVTQSRRDGVMRVVAKRESNSLAQATGVSTFSTTIVNECFRDGTAIVRANAMIDDHYSTAKSVIFQNIHSVICVPIETPEGIVGVIYADTVGESEAFAEHDVELLAAVAKQAGVAIHRVQLAERLRQLLRGAVRALVATIEAKDEYTRGHSERVTVYALQIGKAVGLNESSINTLELGGFLHDLGKIGVPENILRKPGPLTAEEYKIVQQHPVVGEEIVRNIEGSEEIAEIVLHHHERWDGKGYPDGLAGANPSLLARILAVADTFDAMSSPRPYRAVISEKAVLSEMRRESGRQFDPDVVDVFLKEVVSGRIGPEAP